MVYRWLRMVTHNGFNRRFILGCRAQGGKGVVVNLDRRASATHRCIVG
jgi:hypothetical protein